MAQADLLAWKADLEELLALPSFPSSDRPGSLYLSTVPVLQLRRAGRVAGDDEAVRRFAAMADLSEAPYSLTGF